MFKADNKETKKTQWPISINTFHTSSVYIIDVKQLNAWLTGFYKDGHNQKQPPEVIYE